ncbi:MAG TPA: hypothetical protein VF393_04840 [archaeon]
MLDAEKKEKMQVIGRGPALLGHGIHSFFDLHCRFEFNGFQFIMFMFSGSIESASIASKFGASGT